MDGQGTTQGFTEETTMGMSINTNLSALNTYRNLSSTQNDLSKSLEKLSTGLRINVLLPTTLPVCRSPRGSSRRSVASRSRPATRRTASPSCKTAEGGLTETHSISSACVTWPSRRGNDSNNDDSRKGDLHRGRRAAEGARPHLVVDELQRPSTCSTGPPTWPPDAGTGKLAFPGRRQRRQEQPDRRRPVGGERLGHRQDARFGLHRRDRQLLHGRPDRRRPDRLVEVRLDGRQRT